MSTLVSEVIVQAFREGNFIAVGENTTAAELLESIPRLNNYIASLFGIELGEQLRDWYIPQAHNPEAPVRHPLTPTGDGAVSADPYQYPPANVRLAVKVTSVKTLYFPAMPRDGARMGYVDLGSSAIVTLDGNGRFIEGAATLSVPVAVPPATQSTVSGREWFYRADLGNWVRLDVLDEDDEVPFPPSFDDLLVTGLAIRSAPRFQVKIDDSIIARNGDMLARLKKRYKQSESQPTSEELRQIMREI